ncbi:aspartic peptidase domain-containing protein [Dichotomocladium elegans]|nr:aspartic peptidase domain-containing protein [Dichotomocladium elegans]
MYNAIQYLVEIQVGTPPVTIDVAIDTGSDVLWIPSSDCPLDNCPFSRFDPSKSLTLKHENRSAIIDYMVATVSGSFVTDKVQLGSVTFQSQEIFLVNKVSNIYSNINPNSGKVANGMIGLGYQDGVGKAWDHTTAAHNWIFFSSFSIYVDDPNVNLPYAVSQGGELILGGIDSTKFTGGSLTYLHSAPNIFTKVVNQQWALYGQRIQIANPLVKYDGVDIPENTPFVISTMYLSLMLPKSMADGMMEGLVGKDNFAISPEGTTTVKCKMVRESSARLQLQLSDSNTKSAQPVQIDVPVSSLVIAENGEVCALGIAFMEAVEGRPNYFIGISILRHLYLDFNFEEHKVGLAPTVNGKATVTTLNADKDKTSASPHFPVLTMTATLIVFVSTTLLLA